MPLERHMVQGQSQTADSVRSIATFAGKLPNLIQLMPVAGVTALNFKVTWAKVKVKRLVFQKSLSAQYPL